MRPALPYKLRSNAFAKPTRRWHVYALLGVIALLLTILIPVAAYYLKHRPGRYQGPRIRSRCSLCAT